MVHAHDEGGHHVVLGGSGEDHLLCPACKVGGGLFHGGVGAGGFDDVLGTAVVPGDERGVALAVYPDLLAVDDQVPVVSLHRALERAEHGVVFYLIDHIVQIRIAQVDAAGLIAAAAPLHHDPQGHPPDAAEAVDAHFDRHVVLPPVIFCFRISGVALLYHRLFKFSLLFT